MMATARYYFSVFLRRLHWFLIVAMVISAISVVIAVSAPPSYVSQLRLLVESPQIPNALAPPTVSTPALEQLQIFEQRLLTRTNLLDIARRHNVLDKQSSMSPDEIVAAMRARTKVRTTSGQNAATLMTITFEAPRAQTAAAVLGEYLTIIQRQDVEFRTGRAGQTMEFFEQEVGRLNVELDAQSARIVEFKGKNADALPEGMEYRLAQQNLSQERLAQTERDIAALTTQRERLVQIYNATGRVEAIGGDTRTPEQRQLDDMRRQLNDALTIYSAENPRVKMLQARVKQLETVVSAQTAAAGGQPVAGASPLDLQLAEIDTRVGLLKEQKTTLEAQLATLSESIAKTPANAIALDALNRDYQNIQTQYNTAVDRLSKASTGERIELLSRGQRISVIEQPVAPTAPTKPNRVKIAGGGTVLGILAGLALVAGLEFLNTAPRRAEDIVRKLGITPIATIPYIRSQSEKAWQRGVKLALILLIVVGVPALVWGVHTYYQPLDLLAEKVMNKMGVRW